MNSVAEAEAVSKEVYQSEIAYFEISRRKLLIMSVGTLGLYGVYWIYQNWARYNLREDGNTWPLARAIFSLFFMHSLCSKLEIYHKEKTGLASYKLNQYATLYVLLFLTILIPEPSSIALQIVLSTFLLIVEVVGYTYILIKIQDVVNIANGEKLAEVNDKLTFANFAWLALGVAIFLSFVGSIVGQVLIML